MCEQNEPGKGKSPVGQDMKNGNFCRIFVSKFDDAVRRYKKRHRVSQDFRQRAENGSAHLVWSWKEISK